MMQVMPKDGTYVSDTVLVQPIKSLVPGSFYMERVDSLGRVVEKLKNEIEQQKKNKKFSSIRFASLAGTIFFWYQAIKYRKQEIDLKVGKRDLKQQTLDALNEQKAARELVGESVNDLEGSIGRVTEDLSIMDESLALSHNNLRLSFNTGLFTLIIFIGTFFEDDINRWIERQLNSERKIAQNFLNSWDAPRMIVYEASILSTDSVKLTPEQRSLFYFADEKTLGVSDQVFQEELWRYSLRHPDKYAKLKSTAEQQLFNNMQQKILQENK